MDKDLKDKFYLTDNLKDAPPLKKLKIDSDCSAADNCDVPVVFQPSVEYFG